MFHLFDRKHRIARFFQFVNSLQCCLEILPADTLLCTKGCLMDFCGWRCLEGTCGEHGFCSPRDCSL